jgi:hypothetical protein
VSHTVVDVIFQAGIQTGYSEERGRTKLQDRARKSQDKVRTEPGYS